MSKHPGASTPDTTTAEQLEALFAEQSELFAEWQKLYLTPSGKPRKRFTPSQDAALRANNARAHEITNKILTLTKEAKQ